MNNYRIEEKHFTEWVQGSGVDPEIVGLNVRSLSGTNPHEQLLYSDDLPRRNDGRLSAGYLRRCEHWELGGWYCNGIDLLTGYESLWGCFKPDKPRMVTKNDGFDPHPTERKQKPIKYEHPPKVPTEVFALRVPRAIAEAIADRYNIQIPEEAEFWQWVIDHPEIPIVITEGAKKAGALLSAGYCAIASPGIYNGYRQPKDEAGKKTGKPYLIPQLQVLAQLGREFYFGFDSDNKIKTITNVNKAIEKTAKLLEEQGCTCKVIEWSNEHKGVDDLIVAKGVEAFDEAYEQAKSIALWKVARLKQLSYKVFVQIDPTLRYLPQINIPDVIKLIGIKARKGRGKTHQMEDLVAEAIYEGRTVLVLSHRRQLVANLCDRFGIDNVNGFRSSETGGKLGYGLCIDSLRQNSQARFRPHEWADALVIIDEIEQFVWHLLSADTDIKHHRVEILRNFQELLQVVFGSKRGQLLVADADLSDVSLDYIRSLVEKPPEPYIIHQPYDASTITDAEKWDIINYNQPNCQRLVADLIEHIERGGKPFICLSGQKKESIFGTTNIETKLKERFPDHKILRIDSESLGDPEHPAFGCIERINEVLNEYDIVISSSAIETGVSIDLRGHFTSVWGLACGVTSDNAVCQTLARVRENIPRYLWVSKVGFNKIGNGTTNVKELFTKEKEKTLAHIQLLLETEEYEINGINTEFQNRALWCWARMAIRINLGMISYRASVLDYLAAEGHSIHEVDGVTEAVGGQYLDPVFALENLNHTIKDQEDNETTSDIPEVNRFNQAWFMAQQIYLAIIDIAINRYHDKELPPNEFKKQKTQQAKDIKPELKQISFNNCSAHHRYVSSVSILNDREFSELSRRQNRTREDRARLEKTYICRKYNVEDVSPELVALESTGVYSGLRLHYYLTVGRPYLSRKERHRLEKFLTEGQGCLFSPDFNRFNYAQKIYLLDFLAVLPLLHKTQVHQDDPDIQRLAHKSKQYAHIIRDVFHITIKLDDAPMVIYKKLLKPLGIFKLKRLGRFGERGDRHYTYANPDLSDRNQLFERWLASEEPLPKDDPDVVRWALRVLERLESPARNFIDGEAASKFIKAVEQKVVQHLDQIEAVCHGWANRFFAAFNFAIA
ncbi:plasmid replication protein, CyRepA1 family [Crocosphaera chwakensis]|uniref:DUF3854 domain-containing protein n=1 Tax=Crocosphaera chwakensis CCY0110 TaxID=391612 RepID=A3IZ48_9CHRO|nr:plasmid replication protein, CyRepA1 family [Crocosphaera chwakensis]EAZ88252.1 hypothetical protein CY0110_14485 [Crocosphaera chwakensis CCY0110]